MDLISEFAEVTEQMVHACYQDNAMMLGPAEPGKEAILASEAKIERLAARQQELGRQLRELAGIKCGYDEAVD